MPRKTQALVAVPSICQRCDSRIAAVEPRHKITLAYTGGMMFLEVCDACFFAIAADLKVALGATKK